jgi:arylsulfatase A-like enzyme
VPQLKDAAAPRERPAITTHNQGNHGIRSERWRYIRYADGSEELYDMQADPQRVDDSHAEHRSAGAGGDAVQQHYSGNAVCAPSRCVLMTGMHPGHAIVRTNRRSSRRGSIRCRRNVTLPELLKEQGYTTGAFGKWGLGRLAPRAIRSSRGSTASSATTARAWPTTTIRRTSGTTMSASAAEE